MIGIVTRPARPDDLPVLADLRWRLQTDDEEDFAAEDKNRFISAFVAAPIQRDPLTVHFVAETADRIVAAMTVRKVEKIPSPKRVDAFWGYLTNCYVLAEFRDKSVGSQLLDFVTRWAKMERLELLVVWPSDRSYPFYERKGFARHADPLVLTLADD